MRSQAIAGLKDGEPMAKTRGPFSLLCFSNKRGAKNTKKNTNA